MDRRAFVMAAVIVPLVQLPSFALASSQPLKMFKDPNCGCCEGHADYLRAHGFTVTIQEADNLDQLRKTQGIPAELIGCHMIFADAYVIEGHVPAAAISKLLNERPQIKGISVPGMPLGSPGMGGDKEGPLVVSVIEAGTPREYYRE